MPSSAPTAEPTKLGLSTIRRGRDGLSADSGWAPGTIMLRPYSLSMSARSASKTWLSLTASSSVGVSTSQPVGSPSVPSERTARSVRYLLGWVTVPTTTTSPTSGRSTVAPTWASSCSSRGVLSNASPAPGTDPSRRNSPSASGSSRSTATSCTPVSVHRSAIGTSTLPRAVSSTMLGTGRRSGTTGGAPRTSRYTCCRSSGRSSNVSVGADTWIRASATVPTSSTSHDRSGTSVDRAPMATTVAAMTTRPIIATTSRWRQPPPRTVRRPRRAIASRLLGRVRGAADTAPPTDVAVIAAAPRSACR